MFIIFSIAVREAAPKNIQPHPRTDSCTQEQTATRKKRLQLTAAPKGRQYTKEQTATDCCTKEKTATDCCTKEQTATDCCTKEQTATDCCTKEETATDCCTKEQTATDCCTKEQTATDCCTKEKTVAAKKEIPELKYRLHQRTD